MKSAMTGLLAIEALSDSVDPFSVVRPVATTSFVAYPLGGTMKSLLLVALPYGVMTWIGPDATFVGTTTVNVVFVAAVIDAAVPLNKTLSRLGVVKKFVPVSVTALPDAAEVGEKLLIVGAASVLLAVVTVKAL